MAVLNSYMKILWGKTYKETSRIFPKNFVGPSSYTLQAANIAPINEDAKIPNIRKNYTVTDKADGERKLLYIGETGKIYLIDTNMNVQFTGAQTKKKYVFSLLLLMGNISFEIKMVILLIYMLHLIYIM